MATVEYRLGDAGSLGFAATNPDGSNMDLTGLSLRMRIKTPDGYQILPAVALTGQEIMVNGVVRTDAVIVSVDVAPGVINLSPRLHRFSEENPDLDLIVFAEDRIADLSNGEADVALRYGQGPYPGQVARRLVNERLIPVCARDEAEALAITEDALATIGVAAVFAEVEAVDLTAGRRLQLACEKRGSTGFVIRRRPYGGQERKTASGSAAATRWKIAPAASEPGPGEFGLGPPRWRVELERCRGGRTGAWLMEAQTAFTWEAGHGPHPLRLVPELGDRQLAPAQPVRLSA